MNASDGFLSDREYADMGLIVGLEIHQQLATEKKLFCKCPAVIRNDPPTATILRHMRPTLSELGEYDGTALMEFRTRKNVTYQLHRETVCTYEMDDTPPFPINQNALDIALEISLLLGCSIVDELHVSRKQYLDGSIPTGFQRTAIVGLNGRVDIGGKSIDIIQVGLEEDACREIEDVEHNVVFRTDRLSIPLVEVVTKACPLHPAKVKELALELGRIMRCTGKVRRGPGATRQDVNVSVKGGDRVEIKGVSDLSLIPKLVHNEALRQKNLLELKNRLSELDLDRERLVQGDLPTDDYGIPGGRGRLLKGLRNVLSTELQPGRDFAFELSERVRVVACVPGPWFIRWDGSHDLEDALWQEMREELGAAEEDALVVVAGDPADVKTAFEEIEGRIVMAFEGIPRETRQVHHDGTTGFERVLPGPDRMYPDTDSPPLALEKERIERIDDGKPELPRTREERLKEEGVLPVHARELSISPLMECYEKLTGAGTPPKLAAQMLTERVRSARRRSRNEVDEATVARTLTEMMLEGKLHPNGFFQAAVMAFNGMSPYDILRVLPPVGRDEALREWNACSGDGVGFNGRMGELTRRLGTNIPSKVISELVAESNL